MPTNPLRNNTRRVDAHDLLAALAYISRHAGITTPELAEHLGISERTARRILKHAREQFGVAVSFHRCGTSPTGGELVVDDWGVFDARRVLSQVRKSSRTAKSGRPRRA